MSKQTSSRIRLIYGIVLSVSIAIAAVCLMSACLGIYNQGGRPFSREAVAEAFGPIALPVYLCLALVLGGFLLDLLLPSTEGKLTAGRQTALTLKRLAAKTDLSKCSEELRTAILAQRKARTTQRVALTAALILASAAFLNYALNPDNFHQSQINDSMIRAMYVLVPCLAFSFGYGLHVVHHAGISMEKEIALLKQAGPEAKIAAPVEAPNSPALRPEMIRNVLLIAAVALLLFGFFTGGTADVLTKAVNICTECVGLG